MAHKEPGHVESGPSPKSPDNVLQSGKARTIGGSWRDTVIRGSDAPQQGKPVGGSMKPFDRTAGPGVGSLEADTTVRVTRDRNGE